jgi:hypothetical protein
MLVEAVHTGDIKTPAQDRIARELRLLAEGGQHATLQRGQHDRLGPCDVVVYHGLPTSAAAGGVQTTDVLALVSSGYPAAMLDLAGLPIESPLIARVRGGGNPQGRVTTADGRLWQLASYHPHQMQTGPAWDPMVHGFHTYLEHLLAWLTRLD